MISLALLGACGGDDAPELESSPTSGAAATEAPSAEPASTEPPTTEPPTTEPASTEPPTSEAPTTEPATTEPPSTEPRSTEPPSTELPHGGGEGGVFQITANVAGGEPVGGLRSYIVEAGTTVEITVVADTADEGHLHGYDLEMALTAGEPAVLTFTADMVGSFEYELHESGALLFYLDVV